MKTRLILLGILLLILVVALFVRKLRAAPPATSDRVESVRKRIRHSLVEELKRDHFVFGDPVFVRIFKEESQLELWIRDRMDGRYRMFRRWPVANYGGRGPGPKLSEGDGMAPEGFYYVGKRQLNPKSDFHLSFDLGFPNAFDRFHGRSGTFLMVHGSNVSIGCFAMTDEVIEIIYLLAEAALRSGRQDEFCVHSLPFRMTKERMDRARSSPWFDFWKNLKQGNDLFEETRIPPLVGQKDGKYVFRRRTP